MPATEKASTRYAREWWRKRHGRPRLGRYRRLGLNWKDREAVRAYHRAEQQARRDRRAGSDGHHCGVRRCRGILEHTTDRLGMVHTYCPRCARRRAGQCIDCGRAVKNGRWRCDPHLKAHRCAVMAGVRRRRRKLEAAV